MKIGLSFCFFLITAISYCQQWQVKALNSQNPYDSVGLKHNNGLEYSKVVTNSSNVEKTVIYASSVYPTISNQIISDIASVSSDTSLSDSINYIPKSLVSR